MALPNLKEERRLLLLIREDRLVADNVGRLFLDGSELTKTQRSDGYFPVTVEGRTVLAHRVICLCLLGAIGYLEVVNHKDGNKSNFHPSNLEIVTYSENAKHAYATGLAKVSAAQREERRARMVGENNVEAKLSNEMARDIRRQVVDESVKVGHIEESFGLTRRSVENLLKGDTYQEAGGPLRKRRLKIGRTPRTDFSDEQKQEMTTLKNEGLTWDQLAERFGCTRNVARWYVKCQKLKGVC